MFNKKKYFFVSAFSTAIVLSMMLGFIVVEKNVSAIITPKKPPLFSYHYPHHYALLVTISTISFRMLQDLQPYRAP